MAKLPLPEVPKVERFACFPRISLKPPRKTCINTTAKFNYARIYVRDPLSLATFDQLCRQLRQNCARVTDIQSLALQLCTEDSSSAKKHGETAERHTSCRDIDRYRVAARIIALGNRVCTREGLIE